MSRRGRGRRTMSRRLHASPVLFRLYIFFFTVIRHSPINAVCHHFKHQTVRIFVEHQTAFIFHFIAFIFHIFQNPSHILRIQFFHAFHVFFVLHLRQIQILHRITHIKRHFRHIELCTEKLFLIVVHSVLPIDNFTAIICRPAQTGALPYRKCSTTYDQAPHIASACGLLLLPTAQIRQLQLTRVV